ncbi:restriction endonuclease subunit S [Gilliamella apicola]|uniref:restriction endonuclease subunit S n=2 Tax=Gilliamella apicola TaxID=1196095 RepID=UPI002FEDF9E8
MIDANTIKSLLKGVDVEYKNLGEITRYEQPTKYLVDSTDYNDDFKIPVLTAGKTFILGYTNEIAGIYKARNNPVIIFDDFTTAHKWVNFDFKVKSTAMKIILSADDKKYHLKFVYYWLNTLPTEKSDNDHKRQWISNYANKTIPIPSYPIQNKIVNILDTFTALTTELTTELNARLKQYNYYRDKLLSFAEDEVEWKTLDEVFYLKNGYTPSKSEPKFWDNGNIPWFRMEDIRKNGMILNDSLQKINKVAIKGGKLFPANSIIIATSATIGEHALITVPYLSNQRFTNLNLKEEYKNKYDIRFVFYYCFKLSDWCKNNTTLSSFASVDMNGFKKFKFPILPLSKQKQIVEILDKFDTLTNSIAEGLPREIELRQKQYEYYRNLLLDFPKS